MYAIRVTDAPWNIVMDGATDNTAALAALSAHIAGLWEINACLPRLVFPEGICAFTAWPDFAFPRFQITSEGHTRLRKLNPSPIAVDLDGQIRPFWPRELDFGPFCIEGGALRTRHIHTSRIKAIHRGGFAGPAFITAFGVASEFWYTCSVNEWGREGWFGGVAPTLGLYLTWNGYDVAARTSKCIYHKAVMEGLNRGIEVDNSDGNVFHSPVAEGCHDWGMYFHPSAAENVVYDGWFEGNGAGGGGDVFVQGYCNKIINAKSTSLIKFYNSNNGVINSGNHHHVEADATAVNTRLVRPVFTTGSMTGTFIY